MEPIKGIDIDYGTYQRDWHWLWNLSKGLTLIMEL